MLNLLKLRLDTGGIVKEGIDGVKEMIDSVTNIIVVLIKD